jgi:hypothetical protein
MSIASATILRPALLMLALCWLQPAAAQQVKRCTGADGVTVFTDRACSELAATPRLPAPASATAPAAEQAPAAMFSKHCPQRLSQLVEQIQMAVDSGDINRLSALYWWAGQDNASASRQLERLEAIVARPLLDIAPVYPGGSDAASTYIPPPLPPFTDGDGNVLDAGATADATAGSGSVEMLVSTPARPRPYALRLEQSLVNSATPSRSVLRLRRQYGCFWVSF